MADYDEDDINQATCYVQTLGKDGLLQSVARPLLAGRGKGSLHNRGTGRFQHPDEKANPGHHGNNQWTTKPLEYCADEEGNQVLKRKLNLQPEDPKPVLRRLRRKTAADADYYLQCEWAL